MNRLEAADAMRLAHLSLEAAWQAEPRKSRRTRIRTVILKLGRELETNAASGDGRSLYSPAAGNLVLAIRDLTWIRNQAASFAIAPEHQARIASWAASILKRF